jgi:hypothetical protein
MYFRINWLCLLLSDWMNWLRIVLSFYLFILILFNHLIQWIPHIELDLSEIDSCLDPSTDLQVVSEPPALVAFRFQFDWTHFFDEFLSNFKFRSIFSCAWVLIWYLCLDKFNWLSVNCWVSLIHDVHKLRLMFLLKFVLFLNVMSWLNLFLISIWFENLKCWYCFELVFNLKSEFVVCSFEILILEFQSPKMFSSYYCQKLSNFSF